MSVRVKLEMSECIVDDVSQLQEENWRLKVKRKKNRIPFLYLCMYEYSTVIV